MNRFARILLQVQTLDPHGEDRAVVALDRDLALADDRVLKLADLIALGQIGIEIVLPVKARPGIDLGPQPQARDHRLLHAAPIDHRQHTGHGRVHQTDLSVGAAAKTHRGAGEKFGFRGDLGMHLKAQNNLPRPRRAGDGLIGCGRHQARLHPWCAPGQMLDFW